MIKLELIVSDDDLAAIGHAVVDPIEWAQHAFDHVGANAVRAKIEKYRTEYLTAKDLPGYKTAAQRKADADEKFEKERLAP